MYSALQLQYLHRWDEVHLRNPESQFSHLFYPHVSVGVHNRRYFMV